MIAMKDVKKLKRGTVVTDGFNRQWKIDSAVITMTTRPWFFRAIIRYDQYVTRIITEHELRDLTVAK